MKIKNFHTVCGQRYAGSGAKLLTSRAGLFGLEEVVDEVY